MKLLSTIVGTVLALGVLTSCSEDEVVSAEFPSDAMANFHDMLTFKFAGNPEKGERVQYSVFSIIAPQGEHWIEGPPRPEPIPTYFGYQPQVSFTKILPQTAAGPHAVVAVVEIAFLTQYDRASAAANPRRYIQYWMDVRVQMEKAVAGRQTAKSVEAVLDNTLGNCFRFDNLLEDRGVLGFLNSAFLLDVHGYECLDPSSKFLARISYSQRVPPGVEPVDVTREGEEFLKGFKFSEAEG